MQIFLFLLILGIIFVGYYVTLDSKAKTEQYISTEAVEALMVATEANQAHPQVENYFMVGENALPQIPGRIYVLKTESTAHIWHACSETKSEIGEMLSVERSELSERQRLNLLNTRAVPKGWEVVYVDEDGSPIR